MSGDDDDDGPIYYAAQFRGLANALLKHSTDDATGTLDLKKLLAETKAAADWLLRDIPSLYKRWRDTGQLEENHNRFMREITHATREVLGLIPYEHWRGKGDKGEWESWAQRKDRGLSAFEYCLEVLHDVHYFTFQEGTQDHCLMQRQGPSHYNPNEKVSLLSQGYSFSKVTSQDVKHLAVALTQPYSGLGKTLLDNVSEFLDLPRIPIIKSEIAPFHSDSALPAPMATPPKPLPKTVPQR